MAKRPWVTPQEVKAYTDHQEILQREDAKICVDIARAEMKIIAMTNNHFEDDVYKVIPESVKLAAILLAEAYAKNAIEKTKKQIKSETFDDYSYTASSSEIDLASLDLDNLLDEFVISPKRGNVIMRLRKL